MRRPSCVVGFVFVGLFLLTLFGVSDTFAPQVIIIDDPPGGGGGPPPPNPPTLSGSFSTTAASLSWTGASLPAGIAGYEIWWGTSPSIYTSSRDVGNTTSASIYPLQEATTYYFVVRGYDASRSYTPFSNQISGMLLTGGGPTTVSGSITSSTTWTVAGSPYIVTGSVTVYTPTGSPTTVLTIQPGVTVKFNSSMNLRIGNGSLAGTLVAQGTAVSPIVFTANTASPTPGYWGGLYFDDGTVDATTVLQYASVQYGGQYSSSGGIYAYYASPQIRNTTVSGSNGYGVYLYSSGATLMFDVIRDNAGYGVYSYLSASAVVQDNDLSGNAAGAINNPYGSAYLDGRFNWYGDPNGPGGIGPGTGSAVSGLVGYEPWLASTPQEFNYFRDAFSSTPTFRPGSFTRFTAQVGARSAWTVRVFNAANSVVRTIGGNGSAFVVDWDGKDQSGASLPDGLYKYRLDATENITLQPSSPVVGRVSLDGTYSTGEVINPAHLQTFAIGAVVPVDGTAGGLNFHDFVVQVAPGIFPAAAAFTNITPVSTTPISNSRLANWNTTGQTNGTYTVRLVVTNTLSEKTVVNVGSFILTASLSLDRVAFSPNGDGSGDRVVASGTMSVDASWVLNITNVATSSGVKTFTGGGRSLAQPWDGTTGDNVTIAPEGNYRFDLAVYRDGQTVNLSATTALDLTPPTAALTAPPSGATLFGSVGIAGSAYDPDGHFLNYLLEFGAGSPPAYTLIGSPQTVPVTGGTLGTWTTNDAEPTVPVANGAYDLRLTVNDQAGNTTRLSRSVSLDNLLITNVTAAPRTLNAFSANTTRVDFTINKPAAVTLEIYPEAGGALQKSISGSLASGPNALFWDGTNGSGLKVPDEAYIFTLNADAGSGRTDRYAPAAGGEDGAGSGTVDPFYNPYVNDFWRMDYNNTYPARITMTVDPDGAAPPFNVLNGQPHDAGIFTIEWDGRDANGQIVAGNSQVNLLTPRKLKPNFIIMTGNAPQMTGIKSVPHRIFMSYDNVASLNFDLQRDAYVTVTVLPPGVANPADPRGFTLFSSVYMGEDSYEVLFDPVDFRDPNQDLFLFSDEGAYTYAVTAVNPTTGATSLRRGVVNVYR